MKWLNWILLAMLLLALFPQAATAEGEPPTPVHMWTFSYDESDSIGGAGAVLMNGAVIDQGKLILDGTDDYASLPIGTTIAGLQNSTFETWVTWDSYQRPWARIFDFGFGPTVNMFLTPRNGRYDSGPAENTTRFAITTNGLWYEQQLNSAAAFPVGVETHVAVVISEIDGKGYLYVDCELVAERYMSLAPSDLGSTINNYLGKSQYSADPYFSGSINEFRIYAQALTADEVAQSCSAGSEQRIVIDIKPGSDPNCFNVNGHGVIPVAILGSSGFDVAQVDMTSLNFAGLTVRVKGNDRPQCGYEEVSGDNYTDMVCQFVDNATDWAPGDAVATLTGKTIEGQSITGSDNICIVP